eukprot:11696315-Alexandrium_andersonii.AAC.1
METHSHCFSDPTIDAPCPFQSDQGRSAKVLRQETNQESGQTSPGRSDVCGPLEDHLKQCRQPNRKTRGAE